MVQDAAENLHERSEADVVRVTAAAQRVINWAQAQQLRAMGELRTRFEAPEPGLPPGVQRLDRETAPGLVEQEVALACAISEHAAASRLSMATALDRRLPLTRAAAQRGELDWPKLDAIVGAVASLPDDTARGVEQEVLAEGVAGLNAPAVRRLVKRAVIAADPAAADARASAARRSRRVAFAPEPDGMASLWLLGPAERVLCAKRRLEELADSARQRADGRTADQLRADIALDLLSGTGAVAGSGRSADDRSAAEIVVTVPLSTLLGHDETPGDLSGYGAIAPATARDLAERGAWRCAVVDGEHATLLGLGSRTFTPGYRPGAALRRFVQTRDEFCSVPGCHARAQRGDLDHRVPHPAGVTCECNLQALCRTHHGRKTRGALRVAVGTGPGGPASDPPGTLIWTTRAGLAYRGTPTALPSGLAGGRAGPAP
jgi:hypothetical protein